MNFTNNTQNIPLNVGDNFAFLPRFSLHCCSKVWHKIEMNSLLLLLFSWGFFDSDRHEKSEKSFPQELFSKEKKKQRSDCKVEQEGSRQQYFFISSLLYLHFCAYFVVYAALVTVVDLLRHGHTIYTRNNMGPKCEGNCGLWVLNEIIKKTYPENLKKIMGAVQELPAKQYSQSSPNPVQMASIG